MYLNNAIFHNYINLIGTHEKFHEFPKFDQIYQLFQGWLINL